MRVRRDRPRGLSAGRARADRHTLGRHRHRAEDGLAARTERCTCPHAGLSDGCCIPLAQPAPYGLARWATFIAYALREGTLHELARYQTDPERPNELLAWLEPLLSDRPDILPEPRAVAQAFGRTSLTFGQARMTLDALWATLGHDPEVRLKRDLWDGLLREAYGEAWATTRCFCSTPT